ncbi:unnamed protein product [Calypogeia fissa]
MISPPISIAPPHPSSSITSLGTLKPTTFIKNPRSLQFCESLQVECKNPNPRASTTIRSSHWTALSAPCAQRKTHKRDLLDSITPHAFCYSVSRGFVSEPSSFSVVFDRRSRSFATVLAGMAVAEKGQRMLITFDVDGTLMQSTGENANLLHKKAFSYAFKEVFGIDGNIDVIKHHGSTDPLVLINTLEFYEIPTQTATANLPELKSKMLEYAKSHSSQVGEGLELLPGVASLLEILSKRNDVVVALVTGNLEYIGWLKMEGLGIRPFFSSPNFGGFGSDNIERGELVRIAATRAEAFFPGEFSKRVHVGDTPNDIKAAEYGGALAIGVCTGVFSRDDLLAASKSGTAVILDNLADSGVFLKACGLD